MIYVDAMQPQLNAFPCEEVPGEFPNTIGLRKPNGKFLGLDLNDPKAPWTEVDHVGAWESFKKGTNGLVLDLVWNGVRHTFIRPYVEV